MGLKEKIFVLGLGLLVIILIAVKFLNQNDALRLAKERYEAALLGNDKEAAVEAGRAYYKELRGRELTEAEEAIILQETEHISQ